jgi:hypothetical protein
VTWRGCRGALGGQDAVKAEVQLMKRAIDLEMRVPERGEGEERVLLINPSCNFAVPGANAAPAASAPAKKATLL